MTSRRSIHALKSTLASSFERASQIDHGSELASDFSKYLCVLLSGYLEKAVAEILMEYTKNKSHLNIQRYIEGQLNSFTNANATKLINLFGSFNPDWRTDLEGFLVDDMKDAINSVVTLRHAIVHGRSASITVSAVKDYHKRINQVVEHLITLCLPTP